MKTLDLTKATAPLAKYAREAKNETVVVTQHGRPVAAVVPISNADWETISLSTNPDFLALIGRSRARCKPGQGISSAEMRRRLGLE